MRETAIMDFLTNFREDGQGGWAPTAEKFIAAEAWSDTGGERGPAGEAAYPAAPPSAPPVAPPVAPPSASPSGPAARFEAPIVPFGFDPGTEVVPQVQAARPAGFGPPARPTGFGPPGRGGGGAVTTAGVPVLSAEDLLALEELAGEGDGSGGGRRPGVPVPGTGVPAADGAPVASVAPVGGAAPVGSGPAAAAPAAAARPAAVAAPALLVQPPVDRARIVQPIPTWPPPGGSATWSVPPVQGKNIGPVRSRHRPDPRRAARRRAALALGIVLLAALVAVLLIVNHKHPVHLTHLAPTDGAALVVRGQVVGSAVGGS